MHLPFSILAKADQRIDNLPLQLKQEAIHGCQLIIDRYKYIKNKSSK